MRNLLVRRGLLQPGMGLLSGVPHRPRAEGELQAMKRKQEETRVLIVDDHPFLRKGVCAHLQSVDGMCVSAEAATGPEALTSLARCPADVAVVDLSLPGPNGLMVTKDIRINFPRLPVLILSLHDEDEYGVAALRAGARGYVRKDRGPDVLVKAIRAVLRGGLWFQKPVVDRAFQARGKQSADGTVVFDLLSRREQEILHLLGEGHRPKAVATKLKIKPGTVDSHVGRLIAKLGVADRATLYRLASDWRQLGASPSCPTSLL